MDIEIGTEFTFDAAHSITGHEGKCKNIHGHSYFCQIQILGETHQIDETTGILFDFHNIDKIKELLCHKNLNDVIEGSPSAENIALYIYNKLHEISKKALLFRVKMYENYIQKKSWAQIGDY